MRRWWRCIRYGDAFEMAWWEILIVGLILLAALVMAEVSGVIALLLFAHQIGLL